MNRLFSILKDILPQRRSVKQEIVNYKFPKIIKLPMQDTLIQIIRTVLNATNTGSVIDQAIFGTAEAMRNQRVQLFMEDFSKRLEELESNTFVVSREYFENEKFHFLFENIIRRVTQEVQDEKLKALQNALINIIVSPEVPTFEKKSSFVKAIDVIEPTHIRILSLLRTLYPNKEHNRYLAIKDINNKLLANIESDKNFIYSAIDTLANKEYVQSGPVPFDSEQRIDKERQEFRATALGMEFLAFISEYKAK